jgi:hypothetical protein
MITDSPISSLKELRLTKLRLKEEIAACELKIQHDIDEIEKSLQPATLAVNMVKKLTRTNDGFLSSGIRNVIGQVAYNTVFSGYAWPARTLLTFLSKRVLGNVVEDKAPGLIQKAAKWWQARRQNEQESKSETLRSIEKPEFA